MENRSAKMQPPTRQYSGMDYLYSLDKAGSNFSSRTSLHGFDIYYRLDNKYAKLLLLFALDVVLSIVSIHLVIDLHRFISTFDAQVQQEIDHGSFKQHSYPNLTICHPKFFNMRTMKGELFQLFDLVKR